MKFDYKSYPFLQDLEKQNLNTPLIPGNLYVGVYEDLLVKVNVYRDVLNKYYTHIKNEVFHGSGINYVSKNVLDKFDNDINIADKLWRLRNEIHGTAGVLLCHDNQMYLYRIGVKDDGVEVVCFKFEKNMFIGLTTIFWKKEWDYQQISRIDPSFCLEELAANSSNDNEFKIFNIGWYTQLVVTFELFKKYAEIENNKICKGLSSKVKTTSDNYKTSIPIPINIVDSTWFTNITRSEGFNVKGHFALRAYGEGRKERKLVWINPYQKNGYVRKAKMLNL